MLEMVTEARAAGLSQKAVCRVLELQPRTVQRWRRRRQPTRPAANPAPTAGLATDGIGAPPHEPAENHLEGTVPAQPVAVPAKPPSAGGPEADFAVRAAERAPTMTTPETGPTPGSENEAKTPEKQAVAVPPRPPNALTLREAQLVLALIRSREHADESCRDLSLSLLTGPAQLYVSHVTIWEYQRQLGCNGPRGRQTTQGRHTAPDTDWVTGPNMLWAYDITYLATAVRGEFLYLYSLLDHFSRKNIAWLISRQLASAEVQRLWDLGLVNERLLDQPAERLPKSLSDRGAQMRAHSTGVYFHKLGIAQLFSRPRRPNDNPYIESHFATVKTHPAYPGYFMDEPDAEHYFDVFYPWYNDVHPHTRLAMLTPSQVHTGQGPKLLAERAALKAATLAARRAQPDVRPFTWEELIADPAHLPDVSAYPCYSWAGPKAPAKVATPLD